MLPVLPRMAMFFLVASFVVQSLNVGRSLTRGAAPAGSTETNCVPPFPQRQYGTVAYP